jgi:methyltransferase of ATP-grasp peptide maturase system
MTTAVDWQVRARGLVEKLTEAGVLDDPAWRDAVESVPRHVFVPTFYVQQPGGGWSATSAGSDGWLDAVYDDRPLVTALAKNAAGGRVTMSSSSQPALMLRMLAALDVRLGHRVLEIGTGTGYNAGLLAHRLGDGQVFSVDIGAGLVEAARVRLASLGYAPTLAAVHGAFGLPDQAPFDRIIATCSVPAVPWAWAEQLREGGLVLVDVKRSAHTGNLALLRRYPDRLEGRFLPKWATFMAIRDTDGAPPTLTGVTMQPEEGWRSSTQLDPQPWTAVVPWFLASSRLPQRLVFAYRGRSETGSEWATFRGDDGSWCMVRTQPDERGRREVCEGGPIGIWTQFERAHNQWDMLGRPGWDRLGLTVLPDGSHRVWLDEPDRACSWLITGGRNAAR